MKLLVAVAEILAFRKSDRLARHLRHALLPQECYFQTVLGNGGLRIRDRTLHYVHWPNEEVAHPSTLEDLDAVRENRAHFARKLDLEACPELYDELDRITSRP